MKVMHITKYITCTFDNMRNLDIVSDFGDIEIYLVRTENSGLNNSDMYKFLSEDEREKARHIKIAKVKSTYILCHALLRLVIASKLDISPEKIKYEYDVYNKPYLKDNLLYFNISYTAEMLAIAISNNNPVGVDVEKLNDSVDFESISGSFFSKKEREYIFKAQGGSEKDRFFLLWTRKEALLKAVGTGIIDETNKLEVYRPVNTLNKELFSVYSLDSTLKCCYNIYSEKVEDYFVSVAIPGSGTILLQYPGEWNIMDYID